MNVNVDVDGFLSLARDRKEHVGPLTILGYVAFDLFAEALGLTRNGLHTRLRRHKNEYPKPRAFLPGDPSLYFRLADLQQWSRGLKQTPACSAPGIKPALNAARGRPPKAVVVAAAAAGISVKEYRASRQRTGG